MFGHHDDENHDENATVHPDAGQDDTVNVTSNDDTPAVALSDEDMAPPPPPEHENQHEHHEPAGEGAESISDVVSPAGGFPRSTDTQMASHHGTSTAPLPDDVLSVDSTVQDLIDIRQHALKELAPVLDQLDLDPEARFRTIMLVIQATDDQKLVKEAYEAAHGISDEKIRAEALLQVVNEINFFTQQPEA
jgi:hypothetical protein